MTVSCFVQQRHRPIKCWQKWPCMFSRPHLKRPKLFPAYLTVYCWDGDSVSDSFKSNIERGQGANPTQYTRITSKKTSHQLSTLHNAKTNLHHHHEPNSKLAFRNFITDVLHHGADLGTLRWTSSQYLCRFVLLRICTIKWDQCWWRVNVCGRYVLCAPTTISCQVQFAT